MKTRKTEKKHKFERDRAPDVTIRDVARLAGVSMMTVSNAINGRFQRMRPATRTRIETAIQELKYRPYSTARNLRRSEHLRIGMLAVDTSSTFLAHPGHSYVVAGLSNFLSEHGYSLTIQGLKPDRFEDALPLKRIEADALCVALSGTKVQRLRMMEHLARLGHPCAFLHEPTLPSMTDVCTIREDDYGGGYMLARHLLSLGCRKLFVLLPDTTWPAMEERYRGAKAASGRAARLHVVRTGTAGVEDTQAALAAAIAELGKPDGVLAGHDQMGIAALKLFQSQGMQIPRDVRITGFNAFEFWKYSDPVLTTIRAPAYKLGQTVGTELLSRLTHGRFSTRDVVLPVDFVQGGTT